MGSSVTDDVTEPLAAVGAAGRVLPRQIARFGDLLGRELSARAFAARRERDDYDPLEYGDGQESWPLSPGEQLEMDALRAALTSGPPPAPAEPAEAGGSGPRPGLPRPARLRRPSPAPGPRRAAARHRRTAATDQG